LDAQREGLENECRVYRQATNDSDTPHKQNSLQAAEKAFRNEIHALQAECQQQEAELFHLRALREDQLNISRHLADAEYEIEVERNALELESRAFDNEEEQLFQMLNTIVVEEDKLSRDNNLPSLQLDLKVDKERGLRYPLINELRLAYRPKGDIKWNEIQTAWSLAAQLLFVVGTLFHYPSEQWKIVPLSHCAKLIFFRERNKKQGRREGTGNKNQCEGLHEPAVVYQLGHPKANGSKAMRAWNTLLQQVISHVSQKTQEQSEKGAVIANFPMIPFPITPNTVGPIDLAQLNEDDDAGWSNAIHCMTSDLLWLSECTALYTTQQVLWTSAVLQTCQA